MADLFGGLVSAGINYGMQKSLQKDAQDYNTLMFNKANDYNNPLNQMMRFKAAGLNPNLIYGQMNNSAAAPSMSASSAPHADISGIETQQLVTGLIKAQKENIEADTAEKEAGAREKGANAQLITTQEMINKADLDIRQSLADSQINLNEENMNLIKADITKIAQETDNLKVENAIRSLDLQWNEKSFDDRLELVRSQIRATNAQANLSNAQANRIVTLLDQELSNLKAEFSKIEADTSLTQQQKSNLAQQKIIDAADNYYLALATEFSKDGNWFQRNFGVAGAQMVHMFTHLFKFGKNF